MGNCQKWMGGLHLGNQIRYLDYAINGIIFRKKRAIEYFEAGKKRCSEPTKSVQVSRFNWKGKFLAIIPADQCRLAFVKRSSASEKRFILEILLKYRFQKSPTRRHFARNQGTIGMILVKDTILSETPTKFCRLSQKHGLGH